MLVLLTGSSGNAGDCCLGSRTDDEATMDPNEGQGDGGKTKGVKPEEGDDDKTDDDEADDDDGKPVEEVAPMVEGTKCC